MPGVSVSAEKNVTCLCEVRSKRSYVSWVADQTVSLCDGALALSVRHRSVSDAIPCPASVGSMAVDDVDCNAHNSSDADGVLMVAL